MFLPRALVLLAPLALSCGAGPFPAPTTASDARNEDPWLEGAPCPAAIEPGTLHVEDVVEGVGKPVEPGDTVRVHYAAALEGGKTVRESRAGGAPIEIIVGSTKAFCGLDRALVGMRAGGKRRTLVPWSLAFGEKGKTPDVPPKTDLLLTLEVFWPAAAPGGGGAPPINPMRGGGGRRR